uniref:Anthocyanin 5-aromatic acyltransferase n=1 Tax=Solanum tuberosum TaxID=4113 RepID=M1BRS2_SOLTU
MDRGRFVTDSDGYVYITCNDDGVDFVHATATHIFIRDVIGSIDVPDHANEFFRLDRTIISAADEVVASIDRDKLAKYCALRSDPEDEATEVLNDMIQDDGSPPKKKFYELKLSLLDQIGWSHLVVYEKQ